MGANTTEAAVPDPIQELTDRLTASYAHLLTAAIVRDVVQDCYQPLSNARIPNYVPILVEHNSRTKLRQLTRRSDPTVLRKLLGGQGGPGVADGSLPSVASKEWPPGSPGRPDC
ncbi:three-helix bundle dimerization domain-containing protein [Streptomyces sp. SP18BB07]|uniref:three-helix bundle dimerization domain-containing protein n=1 Tax=Streptomyces sp. SP18BB07 TaxID=3002522 RepID=UPI002E77EAFD|nr:hypothetical protein [Streptomyces sp. SP18BB07]MEE1762694.1 hypothetical protein [Streptomyces sp. SP18BB07]